MSPGQEIIIREYREGDELQINLLHNQEYGTTRGSAEWQWEFRDNPWGHSIFVVAEDEGDIIGTQALLPIWLSYNEENILSAKAEATLIRKDYRGLGIFEKLYDKCFALAIKNGITLIWGFSIVPKSYRRCGFEIPGNLRQMVLVFRPSQGKQVLGQQTTKFSLYEVGRRFAFFIFGLICFINFKTRHRRGNTNSDFRILSMTQADEILDVFWQTWRQGKRFYTINRTKEYLNWRIFRNPYVTYQLLAAVRDDEIQGYIILSKSKDRNQGFIDDFCVLDDKYFGEVTKLLIAHSIDYFLSQGVVLVSSWYLGNNPEEKKYLSCLRSFGFLPIPRKGTPIVLKSLVSEASLPGKAGHLDQWFITRLFSEGVS